MATKIGAPKNEFPIKSAESMLPVIAGNTVFVVADTETTGFGAYDDILEIGAVKIDVETHKVIQSFSTYCRMKTIRRFHRRLLTSQASIPRMWLRPPRSRRSYRHSANL